jgi:hypothetical protein
MRTYDVAAFQIPAQPFEPAPQKLWELDGAGRAVTGILKLAQRVLIELNTVRGSQPFNLRAGTSLLPFARQGRIRNEIDAHVYFQYAVGELQQNLIPDELTDEPADEKFSALTILSLTFTPVRLSYTLRLVSQDGDSRELILPVSTIPAGTDA